MAMVDVILAGVAATAASIFFGASVVATRFVVHDIDPLLLAFIRYLIATLCLAPVIVIRQRAVPRAQELLVIAALGIIFFGLFPWCFSAGLQYIPASRAALWLATMPLLTLSLAALLRYERVTGPKVAGISLATFGVWVALGIPASSVIGIEKVWVGDFLLILTACFGAIYFVLSKPLLKQLPALVVTCLSMGFGALFLGLLNAGSGKLETFPTLSPAGWLAVAFLGTFGAALGFLLWIWALQHSTPTRTSVFLTLNPMAATLLGSWLLDEPITMPFLTGLACVLAGVIVANLQPFNRTTTPVDTSALPRSTIASDESK